MEIYNEVVRDLLTSDSNPLRVLDDPEVKNLLLCPPLIFLFPFLNAICLFKNVVFPILQRGTVVEKLVEERLVDWNHLMHLLSVCEGEGATHFV